MHRGLKIALVLTCINLITIAPASVLAQNGDAVAVPLIAAAPANGQDALGFQNNVVIRQRVVRTDASVLTGGAVPRALVLQLFQDIQ